jgi:hypothetical protein
VQFSQCPYDGQMIAAETLSGGSLLLTCDVCGASWELHGAWIRRVAEPDRDAVRVARAEAHAAEPAPNNERAAIRP